MQRAAKIVCVFVLVGPFIAGTMAFGGAVVLAGPYAFSEWPWRWFSFLFISYQVGAPYAVFVGIVFSGLAIRTQWSQLYVALLVACLPLLIVSAFVGPALWDLIFPSAFVLVIVPITCCWLLTRRWHKQVS